MRQIALDATGYTCIHNICKHPKTKINMLFRQVPLDAAQIKLGHWVEYAFWSFQGCCIPHSSICPQKIPYKCLAAAGQFRPSLSLLNRSAICTCCHQESAYQQLTRVHVSHWCQIHWQAFQREYTAVRMKMFLPVTSYQAVQTAWSVNDCSLC